MPISSAGVGSGLDVASIISQLMAVEQRPLTLMKAQAAQVETKLSVYAVLQSRLTSTGDIAQKLGDAANWKRTTAGTSQADAVGVSATDAASAATLQVGISQLAQAQSISTLAAASSSAVVGTGTLHIELGAWSANFAGFTAKVPASSVDIEIGSGEQTLAGIRDKINASDAGITATILNDASGSRLVLRSSTTGTENGFRISVTDLADASNTDATGLSMLAFDPPSGTTSSGNQRGLNLTGTVNGAAVSSATNVLENIVDGVTVTAKSVTTTPATLTIAADTEGFKSQIQQFVAAYNDTIKLLREQTLYNADADAAAALQGDRVAVGLQGQLRALIGSSSGASSVYTRLSDIGLEQQRDGSIKIDETKLGAALTKLPEISKLFSNVDAGNAANTGIARRFDALADSQTATDGALATHQEGLRQRLDRNEDEQDRFSDRLTAVEARLRAQYSALDTKMSQLNGLSSYITQQIQLWNKTNASS